MKCLRVTVIVLAAAVLTTALPADSAGDVAGLRQGVSSRRVKLGFHVPMTGAAPLPSDSASKGVALYWRWLRRQDRPINGRHVTTVVKNDNYNPSQAVAVCKEMVEENHVFLLAGVVQGSGVNQMQACARYAASVGVPYISLGMTKINLKQLPSYFAVTATWPREAQMAADLLISNRRARRDENAIVWMNSPLFKDAHDAFRRTMEKRGAEIHYNRSVPNGASQSDAEAVVTEMKALGIDNVFILSTPVWFIQVLQASRTHDFRPLWTGTGTTSTSGDAVASVGCRNGPLGRSRFMSPIPAFADRNDFDPRHHRAMRQIHDERGDSITWLGWAGSKAIAKLLEGTGRDLSRSRFVRTAERDRKVRTGIFPRFGFRPRDHFGGRAVHVLKADCDRRKWVTVRRFVFDF